MLGLRCSRLPGLTKRERRCGSAGVGSEELPTLGDWVRNSCKDRFRVS